MLIWGSISTPRTPLSCVLQKGVTPNHSHSCCCTHCTPPWRTPKRTFLVTKLRERLGLGARVEIPSSGLSSGVSVTEQTSAQSSGPDALGKDQGEHAALCTQGQSPPSMASLPLPSLPKWIRNGPQSPPVLLISTAPALGSPGALSRKGLRIVLTHFIHFSLVKACPGRGTSASGASVCV